MQTVRDADGRRYLLLDRTGETWLVYDPAADERRRFSADDLATADEGPLAAGARAVPDDVRRVAVGVRDEAGLGLLVDLADRGPTRVRAMLDRYDQCESDLHGLLADLSVADLIEEVEVAGERGYRCADGVAEAVEGLRSE